MEKLKQLGGPFTDTAEVEKYLESPTISKKLKKERMKMELQFARDSSITLPKCDPLFRVMVTMPNNRSSERPLSVAFLGKQSDRVILEYSSFKTSLQNLIQ